MWSNKIFAGLMLTLAFVSSANAQMPGPANRAPERAIEQRRRERFDQEIARDQATMRMLEMVGKSRPADRILERQVRVTNSFKELQKTSDEIMKKLDDNKDESKKIAGLAGKVAKLCRQLREQMRLDDKSRRIDVILPPDSAEKQKDIKNIGENIQTMMGRLNIAETMAVYDPSQMQKTSEQLFQLEAQALALQTVAKNK
jgi:predicted membrane chloride channel (bestrophin family)